MRIQTMYSYSELLAWEFMSNEFPSDIHEYSRGLITIDNLKLFLKENGIDPPPNSYFGRFFEQSRRLAASSRQGEKINDSDRAAYASLLELALWIRSIEDCPEFGKIIPHLKLLGVGTPSISTGTAYINPLTSKPDDASNKIVETILGMFAIKIGTDIELDDPVKSSGGTNPDIMFSFFGKRVAFACKTLHASKVETTRQNLESAARQIKRANCDVGFIVLNLANLIPHEEIMASENFNTNFDVMNFAIKRVIQPHLDFQKIGEKEVEDTFADAKVSPLVTSFIHTVAKLYIPGLIALDQEKIPRPVKGTASVKGTHVSMFGKPENYIGRNDEMFLLTGINFFIHRLLESKSTQ